VRDSNLVPVKENVHLCPQGFIAVFTLMLNLLNVKLNPIFLLLALLAHPILHVTRIRVKL
jgi:hypothetical protein